MAASATKYLPADFLQVALQVGSPTSYRLRISYWTFRCSTKTSTIDSLLEKLSYFHIFYNVLKWHTWQHVSKNLQFPKSLPFETAELYRTLVPVLAYGSEEWHMTHKDEQILLERKILPSIFSSVRIDKALKIHSWALSVVKRAGYSHQDKSRSPEVGYLSAYRRVVSDWRTLPRNTFYWKRILEEANTNIWFFVVVPG